MTTSNGAPTQPSAPKTWPWLVYNTALGALVPVWGPYAAWRLTRGNSRPGREQRLGYGIALPESSDRVWLHGASVGEMMALRPIADRFRARHPDSPVVVTTITPTGQEQALKAFPWAEDIRYFPIDTPGPVRRALRAVKPRVVAMVETELWPNFVHAASGSANVVLVNGRISDRTYGPARKARPLYHWMLRHFRLLGVQTETDAERLEELGAPMDRVRVLGTSKFDEAVPHLDEGSRRQWREELGLGTDRVLIAGSTFPGEEEAVVAAFAACRQRVPGLRLMVAPRHIERAPDVARVVREAGLTVSLRSDGRPSSADVIVVDTYGELATLYGLADAAFVGRSLTERGGQNLIQPMAHGVPVVFGPNMQNFRDVAALAEAAGAAVRVPDAAGLRDEWLKIVSDEGVRSRMGEAGRALVAQNHGAADRYADLLLEALE